MLFLYISVPYCSYFSHVESYLQRNNDPNILIVSYEDLSKDPATVIQVMPVHYVVLPYDYEFILV